MRRFRANFSQARGFSLVELMTAVALLGLVVAVGVPSYTAFVERARVGQAVAELSTMAASLDRMHIIQRRLPASLAEVGLDGKLDPWGNPYVYLLLEGANRGQMRKDRNLVPINTRFDLYSMGPDGRSVPPLTARHSRDDIVLANDGGFIGVAEDY